MMVTAPSDCSVCPSVLMSQQPGQLQHPLGTGPHLSSHSYNFPKLDKVSIREGYVGKMTCISEIWSKVVCVERERKSTVVSYTGNTVERETKSTVVSYTGNTVERETKSTVVPYTGNTVEREETKILIQGYIFQM